MNNISKVYIRKKIKNIEFVLNIEPEERNLFYSIQPDEEKFQIVHLNKSYQSSDYVKITKRLIEYEPLIEKINEEYCDDSFMICYVNNILRFNHK